MGSPDSARRQSSVSAELLWKVGWASRITFESHSRLVLDVRAQNLCCSAILLLDVDAFEGEVFARGILRAVHACSNIIPTRASYVLPPNTLNGDPAIVAARARVYARRDINWLVDIVEYKIAKGHITNVTLGWVCLDPGRVGGVVTGEVVEDNVVDRFCSLLADGTDGCAARLKACHIFDINVGTITLYRDAILKASPVSDWRSNSFASLPNLHRRRSLSSFECTRLSSSKYRRHRY